jgi:peptidoglycan-associated lipoprotein
LALAWLVAASPASADFGSGMTLKLGGSGLYNHRLAARQAIVGLRQAGGHISLDIPMRKYEIAVSPFLDIYHRVQTDASSTRPRNDVATNILAGANFLFTGFTNDRATLYMGLGAGVARMKVVSVVNVPIPRTSYSTKPMADALMGLEVKVMPAISVFVEPHYMWTTRMLNGLAVHAGLALHLNQRKAAPPARPVPLTPMPVRIRSEAPVPKAPEPMKTVEEVKPRVSSAEALATMEEKIYFKNDRSDLSREAKMILNEKVKVFQANPAMRIAISGFASKPGTAEYNMALGLRRAESARAYLVSQGVNPDRIEIATQGEGHLAVQGPGKAANAANRRNQFRLLIADLFLEAPNK